MSDNVFKDIKLQGASKNIIKDRTFELLVEGPVRSSKSYSILTKLHALMSKYPNARALILRKTKCSLSQSILQTFEDEILGNGHYLCEGPTRANRQYYKYKNGSEIVIGGLDKPSKIMSSEYDIIYIAEATEIEEDALKHLVTRMSCDHFKDNSGKSWQQIILDCNPTYPHHWLNVRFNSGDNRNRIFIGHNSNPKLYSEKDKDWTSFGAEYINNLKNSLSGVQFTRLFEGKWAMGDSLVYTEFDKEKHLIDNNEKQLYVDKIMIGVDFGWHVGAATVCAYTDKQIAYIIETYAHSKMQLDKWIDIFKGVRDRYPDTFVGIVADSAEPRSIEQIQMAGLNCQPVKKTPDSIKTGIQLVKKRLCNNGIYIYKDAKKSYCSILDASKAPQTLADEFYSYEFDKENDKPISKDNHLLDSLRYLCLTNDKSGNYEYIISGSDSEDDEDMWHEL